VIVVGDDDDDDDIGGEGKNVVAKRPFSIPKLHLKHSSSSPRPNFHFFPSPSSSSSSPRVGVCTGVESVDVIILAVLALLSVGEDISNVVFTVKFGVLGGDSRRGGDPE
jgi:hypothetical protein